MSCNISRTITGNYGRNCNFTNSRFLIDRDNSFCYNYQTEGTGRKEWSCGQWEEISKNRILLTSILHDSVPIYVSEYIQNIGNKLKKKKQTKKKKNKKKKTKNRKYICSCESD